MKKGEMHSVMPNRRPCTISQLSIQLTNFSVSTCVPEYSWVSPREVFASSWFRLAAVLPGTGTGQVVKIKVVL